MNIESMEQAALLGGLVVGIVWLLIHEHNEQKEFDHWKTVDYNTPAATLVAQTVPGILLSCFITKAQIHITNRSTDTEKQNYVTSVQPLNVLLPDLDGGAIARVTSLIESEVMDVITENGLRTVDLDIVIDCSQEIVINISVREQPSDEYIVLV